MADDNRARILDLAVAAIDAGGEAAVRVNHIVEEAGVTPPVLYYHFGSRDGLVIAAQVERYTRQTRADIRAVKHAVEACESRDEVRAALIDIWTGILAQRVESRWRRASVIGSAYARPELESAVMRAQDDIISGLSEPLEACRQRGWLREGIDLPSAVAWQHSVLMGRVYVEHGTRQGDLEEWDRLTLDAFVRAFFGD